MQVPESERDAVAQEHKMFGSTENKTERRGEDQVAEGKKKKRQKELKIKSVAIKEISRGESVSRSAVNRGRGR